MFKPDPKLRKAAQMVRGENPDAYQFNTDAEIAEAIDLALADVHDEAIDYLSRFGSLQGLDLEQRIAERIESVCRRYTADLAARYRAQREADEREHRAVSA